MAKKFKSKKRHKNRFFKILLLIILIFTFSLCLSFFASFFSNESVLYFLLDTNLKWESVTNKRSDIIDFLLDYTIGRQEIEEDVYDGSNSKNEYISDPDPKENHEYPVVYIYNTHQGEEYVGDNLQEHDVIPTVMLASYRLREKLNQNNIYTMVETNKISEILKINNWNYGSSYKASKLLMSDAKEKNQTLKYFLDIHRDSVSYKLSTLDYNGKKYAKVLFVVGTDYEGFEKNLEFSEKLSEKINTIIPGLSRGVLKKGGKGVNGIYNQDFSSNTLLIELGGTYNKLEEVTNTVDIISESLLDLIGWCYG